jgi:ribosomal protein S18 acetylase RimI-like enzyme
MNNERLVLIRQLCAVEEVSYHHASMLSISDGKKLGTLLYNAYKNTVDDEGETLEQSISEAVETFAGKYGPLIPEASFAIVNENGIMESACVVVERDGPFIAFLATDPAFQGRGLGRALMMMSMNALNKAGRSQVVLVVTAANLRAVKLYESLGFEVKI